MRISLSLVPLLRSFLARRYAQKRKQEARLTEGKPIVATNARVAHSDAGAAAKKAGEEWDDEK